MSEILGKLNEELEQVRVQREGLRAKHNGAVMPEEARAQDEELTNRATRIRQAIEVEKQKDRDRLFEDTASFMDDPRHQVQHPVNVEDDSRRDLMKAGWDMRGGTIYRNTARGEIAFCPSDVLFGPMPTDDAVAARHFSQMRATIQPEYRDAWAKWFRNRGSRDVLTGAEQNALSEGVSTEGGYLVPPDIAAEIMARRADASVMRSICTVRQTTRDRIQFPAVAPHGTSGSIYSSGFVGGMVGERPTNTDNGPTFEQFEISVKKFEAYTKVTNDLIADSGADVMAFLATDGGRNLGLVEDNKFITGTGTGLEPLGILNSGITTADVEGSTSNTISNSTSDAGSAPKILALAYLVPEQYTSNARWLMRRAIKGDIHALVDADSRPWWQPASMAGGSGMAPGDLVGFPVSESPFMPNDGTDANKVLVVGDFSAYIIAERTSLSVTIDTVNLVGTDETQIFLRSRAGGGLWNTDALRVGIV